MIIDKIIKDLDLVDTEYVAKKNNWTYERARDKVRQIRLIMLYDGFIVPHGYISRKYLKKYSGSISWKKYDKERLDFLSKDSLN